MTTWDDPERRKLLQDLLAKGLSASKIALEIGDGITRNAVIGAAHRYGYYRRENPLRKHLRHVPQQPPSRPSDDQRMPRFPVEKPIPYVEIDVPPDQRKTLVDLEPDDCRWPIGDPQHADFTFCNQKKIIGKSYCAHHCRIAYEPPVPATRTRHAPRVANPVRETEDA